MYQDIADPFGVDPNPDPTFERKPDPDQTVKKKTGFGSDSLDTLGSVRICNPGKKASSVTDPDWGWLVAEPDPQEKSRIRIQPTGNICFRLKTVVYFFSLWIIVIFLLYFNTRQLNEPKLINKILQILITVIFFTDLGV